MYSIFIGTHVTHESMYMYIMDGWILTGTVSICYICMYICMCKHMYIHMHMCICTCVYVCMYTYANKYIHVNICI